MLCHAVGLEYAREVFHVGELCHRRVRLFHAMRHYKSVTRHRFSEHLMPTALHRHCADSDPRCYALKYSSVLTLLSGCE